MSQTIEYDFYKDKSYCTCQDKLDTYQSLIKTLVQK